MSRHEAPLRAPGGQPFGRTLLVGAGPAAVHTAVQLSRGWCTELGLANRPGAHSVRLKEELQRSGQTLYSIVQAERCRHLSGEAKLSRFHVSFAEVEEGWQTLVLCTPSDSYREILEALRADSRRELRTIILLSPAIGSNLLVRSLLGSAGDRVEVVSLSNYYAATKWEPGRDSVIHAYTKACKKRVYLASSGAAAGAAAAFAAFMESMGIGCRTAAGPVEAESRNITTYVHPPLLLSDFSLDAILSERDTKKSMYKLYPEGPITPHTIRTMVLLWKEISSLVEALGAAPLNLLQFLNDDNYPVHEQTLSRADIEGFLVHEPVKQEYLLYVRYASILIDPFSEPDEHGRYFDFSAVPYRRVELAADGTWSVPRIPHEDYRRLTGLRALARKAGVGIPTAESLIAGYERSLTAFAERTGRPAGAAYSPAPLEDADADRIWKEWQRSR
ncbi:opine metallophore biosynthesis dehydrogenase [Paenibacillus sp. S-38]|uniref:opine metallophore biosynthesis dehydrogenase n=1 Tax=Paenibacillus sp. S-38 TaxID=3416710 RepID=UPI003CE94C2E